MTLINERTRLPQTARIFLQFQITTVFIFYLFLNSKLLSKAHHRQIEFSQGPQTKMDAMQFYKFTGLFM